MFQAIQIFLGPSCSVCLGDGMMTVYCVLTVWSQCIECVDINIANIVNIRNVVNLVDIVKIEQ